MPSSTYLLALVGGLLFLRILLAVKAGRTIAAQRRANEAVQESEHKYRLVVENATEAIVVVQDGRIKFHNRKTREASGYTDEELAALSFTDIVHPDDLATAIEHYRERLREENVSDSHQMRIIDKHGHEKWAEVNAIRIEWEGRPATLNYINDVTARKQVEDALKENEEYLRAIVNTIQAGVLIVDPNTRKIVDANPYAAEMFGCEIYELLGRDYHDHMFLCTMGLSPQPQSCDTANGTDCVLRTVNNGTMHVRRSMAKAKIKGHDFIVQGMLNITDIKELLRKQEINIDLASNILGVINQAPPSYTALNDDLDLYVQTISLPCYACGGDHYFIRKIDSGLPKGHGQIIISLKDQSGHEVGCVLRSILTDLIHNTLLTRNIGLPVEKVITLLNDEICKSELFQLDDFFTAINAELDRNTLSLRYVSCGHVPFFLIRGNEIVGLPESRQSGTNIPMAVSPNVAYTAGECDLQPGDKLIFYTDGLNEMPFRNRKKVIDAPELKKIISEIVEQDPLPPVSEIVHAMVERIAEMSGEVVIPQNCANGPRNSSGDDVTILGLEIEDRRNCRQQVWKPQDGNELNRLTEALYATLKAEWQKRDYDSVELRLKTACEESILNAWKHGNRQDPAKAITVRWRFGNEFHLEVQDEGLGFDFENLPDPTAEANITRPSGRGIFLLRHLADSVQWKQNGKNISLAFGKHAD